MERFKKPLILILITISLLALAMCVAPKKQETQVTFPADIRQERFQYALKIVLAHEGAATNDKDDPGGATHWGISLKFLKEIAYDVDKDGDVDKDDIFKLTKTDADEIYLKDFWDKYNFDDIQDLTIATKLFDTCVNIGPSATNRLIRETFNAVLVEKVPTKGPIDDDILYMLNMVYPDVFLDEFREKQANYYNDLIKDHPKLKKYQKGWLRRAAS